MHYLFQAIHCYTKVPKILSAARLWKWTLAPWNRQRIVYSGNAVSEYHVLLGDHPVLSNQLDP